MVAPKLDDLESEDRRRDDGRPYNGAQLKVVSLN